MGTGRDKVGKQTQILLAKLIFCVLWKAHHPVFYPHTWISYNSHSPQKRLHGISEQQREISLNTRSAYNVLQNNI